MTTIEHLVAAYYTAPRWAKILFWIWFATEMLVGLITIFEMVCNFKQL